VHDSAPAPHHFPANPLDHRIVANSSAPWATVIPPMRRALVRGHRSSASCLRESIRLLDAVGWRSVPTPTGATPRQIGAPATATLLPIVNVTTRPRECGPGGPC
jgi:hypothetical protein